MEFEKFFDGGAKKSLWGAFIFVILIIISILLGVSFSTVGETEMCLEYDKYTKVVKTTPITRAGRAYTGLTGAYLCFPKQIMTLEFSSGPEANSSTLTSRSKEGLDVSIDVIIEYRLNEDESLYTLFQEVGFEYNEHLIRIARSTLRNTASKFNATDFLGANRQQFSDEMNRDLSCSFSSEGCEAPFSLTWATVLSVQFQEIILPYEFDTAIREVTSADIDARKALQERDVSITLTNTATITNRQQLESSNITTLIEANKNLTEATLDRDRRLVEKEIERAAAYRDASTNRNTTLEQAKADIETARAEKDQLIQQATTDYNTANITLQTSIEKARADAQVTEINAKASADAFLARELVKIEGLRLELEAERDALLSLRSTGLAADDLVRFKWIEVLQKMSSVNFFIDYKKVPYLLESGRSGNAAVGI